MAPRAGGKRDISSGSGHAAKRKRCVEDQLQRSAGEAKQSWWDRSGDVASTSDEDDSWHASAWEHSPSWGWTDGDGEAKKSWWDNGRDVGSTSDDDSWHASTWEGSPSSWGWADTDGESPPPKLTGLRFVVEAEDGVDAPPASLGPERLRVVGDAEALGEWDPHLGVDLFWEGRQWTSLVLDIPAELKLNFCLLHVEDAPEILDLHPWESQSRRRFKWDPRLSLHTPEPGEVLEVVFTAGPQSEVKSTRVLPRSACTVRSAGDLKARLAEQPEQSQRCYTFDGPDGTSLDFCLYLPPGFRQAARPWPLLVFLHAMHARLDGDISLFYESEAPPQLLTSSKTSEARCPGLLRSDFVVLCPQCPRDKIHMYGSGVWFRTDWYRTADYMPEVEAALAGLIEALTQQPLVDPDFVALTGTSMGGMGCLEFASRRPGLVKVCAPVAAHYEFDLDELVGRLTQEQALPLWFFHACEDMMCPVECIDELVKKLRARSRAAVHYTRFSDNWSFTGHCADRVSYHVVSRTEGQQALGNELFAWMLEQRHNKH